MAASQHSNSVGDRLESEIAQVTVAVLAPTVVLVSVLPLVVSMIVMSAV
jgi:hypothetical protein